MKLASTTIGLLLAVPLAACGGGGPDIDLSQSQTDLGLVTNGDVGYFNADGYLFICDRVRDMVISGGVNIYPAEIESVIIDYPGVRDCAVFGIPDDEYGEKLAALIEPAVSGGIVEAELRAFLKQHLARYKIPGLIEFRKDLPREDTGKIFKRKLREPYWRDAGRQI